MALKHVIEDTIRDGNFSVDEGGTKKVCTIQGYSMACTIHMRAHTHTSNMTACLVQLDEDRYPLILLQRNILRVGLSSLGSPLWLDRVGVASYSQSLLQFLHSLRALLRRAYAIALVTVPTHLIQVSALSSHHLFFMETTYVNDCMRSRLRVGGGATKPYIFLQLNSE